MHNSSFSLELNKNRIIHFLRLQTLTHLNLMINKIVSKQEIYIFSHK